MPIALTREPREYVLNSERELPDQAQTVFLIRPISARERARFEDKKKWSDKTITTDVDNETREVPLIDNWAELGYECVLMGLAGWRNFKYEDGSECVFSKETPSDNLDCLSRETLLELYVAILKLSEPSPTEQKN